MSDPRSVPIRALACPIALSVGAVSWPASAKVTIIVKLTFELTQGVLTAELPGDPLSLDVCDENGEILYPSDFAPFKPRGDVVIVGDDVRMREHEAMLTCGSMMKRAPSTAQLGGRALFAPAGDPSEPSAEKAWGSGKIDFGRFQCAPPDQRIDMIGVPFRIFYQRGEIHFGGEFQGPVPEALLVDMSGQRQSTYIALLLDTICLAPSAAQCRLVWRGICDTGLVTPGAALVGVTLPSMRARSNQDVLAWPRRELVFPWQLRNQPDSDATHEDEVDHLGETIGIVGMPVSPALPFSESPGAPAPAPRERLSDPRDLARQGIERASPWQASTALVSLGAPPPREQPPAAPPPPEVSLPTQVEEDAPAPSTAPKAPTEPPARDIELADCARIAASIARRPSEKDAILKQHEVDEAAWSAADARICTQARGTAARSDPTMVLAYDAAYVDQLEKERGPIDPTQWARIVVAAERGTTNEVLEALSLPMSGLAHIERVWLKRIASDMSLGKAVNRAAKAARGK